MLFRILVIANKSWEVDPLLGVLRSDQGRPSSFSRTTAPPVATVMMNDGSSKSVPARTAFVTDAAVCEVWCIKDLMDPKKSGSSSEEKARVLPAVVAAGATPDLVVAFGTATIAEQASYNGSVVIGSKVFVHDPYANTPNPDSRWTHADVGRVIDETDSSLSSHVLMVLDREHRPFIESRFLAPPLNPAQPPILLPSAALVALSNVNVTNYDNYVWADPKAIEAFSVVAGNNSVGSVETTHGVIRLVIPSPRFLFVSGIANRLGRFNMELAPRSYAQNFAASHNAAVALAATLPALM